MKRTCLRAAAMERAGGRCDLCPDWGTSLGHLHSIGMGGRKSADTLSNVMWVCERHARWTDGEYAAGERDDYIEWHEALIGEEWVGMLGPGQLAWKRAEALQALVRKRYGEET